MKTKQNGKYVIVETQDDWEQFLELECVCGHTASQHRFQYLKYDKRTIELGACTVSGHCQQFRLTSKRETFSYA